MKTMYYAAYGSNLNIEQMKFRCPTAEIVGTGLLEDYQMMFDRYATIIPEEGGRVPVAVWKIDEECEKALDIYEGFPFSYHKTYLNVEIDGKKLKVMAYVLNRFEPRLPRELYYDCISDGYEDFDLDECYLLDALGVTYSMMEKLAERWRHKIQVPPWH